MAAMTPIDAQLAESRLVAQLVRALKGLRYGSVEITVHDGRVTQIERRERTRMAALPAVVAGPEASELKPERFTPP